MKVVGVVQRCQSTPKETNILAAKRIFKYLKATMEFGLWCPKCQNVSFTTYTYVDWARSVDDMKRIGGGSFFLENCLVAWLSKKKPSISLFTLEVVSCYTQILWMNKF